MNTRSLKVEHQLLLLSPPPTDLSDHTLNAAYGPAIKKVLDATRSSGQSKSSIRLDIAVQCRSNASLASNKLEPYYESYEKPLAAIYRLLVYISAELNLEYQHMPDVAVILIDDPLNLSRGRTLAQQRRIKGPVIPLETLASSQRPWTLVYAVDGEASGLLYKKFTHRRWSLPLPERGPPFDTQRVAGGAIMQILSQLRDEQSKLQVSEHSFVILGGTFDHLHAGHKLLLTATALLLKHVGPNEAKPRSLTVGITGDELLKNKKYAEYLESWEARQSAVYKFLSAILNFDTTDEPQQQRFSEPGPNGKAVHYKFDDGLVIKCVEIWDPYGPTITEEAITALVVSAETRSGGRAVNDKRIGKGWKALEIFEVDVLDTRQRGEAQAIDAEAFESKISSTEIRRRLQQASS